MRNKSTLAALLAMTGSTHSAIRGRVPHGPLVAALAVAAATGVLVGCGGGNGSASAAGSSAGGGAGITISSRQVSGVGTVLTDQSGKTLYTPSRRRTARSSAPEAARASGSR